MAQIRNYPLGVQTFAKIREEGMFYVDKTDLVYQLANVYGKCIFLNRPRRFGKSLLASTLHSYFEGKKELFEGLTIEQIEKEWTPYPVLHFDMSVAKHKSKEMLLSALNQQLIAYEKLFDKEDSEVFPNERLSGLIKRAAAQSPTGKAVVLIDEYDAPLLDVVHQKEHMDELRQIMRNFYSPLKACDAYLRFVFITGITKFSQLSIFSELNNLNNVSMKPAFAAICGFTKEEVLTVMKLDVERLAANQGMTYEEAMNKLQQTYDGYHFCAPSPDIYNPFSIVAAFTNQDFDHYWFGSGTPTYLVHLLRKFNTDVTALDGCQTTAEAFDAPTENMSSPLPVLYQSGYLTIKKYNPISQIYTLGFPNTEVRIGMLRSLVPYYVMPEHIENGSFVARFFECLYDHDLEQALVLLKAYLAAIPYDLENKTEKHYQTIFYILFSLLGQYIQVEVKSATGRADIVLHMPDTLYVMELKLDGSAEAALRQIDEKGYLIPYTATGKQLVKVGINFSSQTRTVENWLIEKQS